MPPHKGHELMIQFGLNMCTNMHVLVSGTSNDEPYPSQRAKWLEDTFPHANIKWEWDIIGEPTYDDLGVGIEPWFWDAWTRNIQIHFGAIDAVFSNDAYGKRLAQELNADWVPIDPDRSVVNISATQIRKDIRYNYEFINDNAKKFYQKKVAIVGPESTGKSSMAKYLSKVFNADLVPEYGRTISETNGVFLTEKDFLTILIGHQTLIDASTGPLVIVDTESYTTKLFADFYLGISKTRDLNFALHNQNYADDYDLYIVLAPTTPWINDGTRLQPSPPMRDAFYLEILYYLNIYKKNYVIINDPNYDMRRVRAVQAIKEKLRTRS